MRYDFKKIESKWQARWLKEKIYEPDFSVRRAQDKSRAKKPFYNLMMFPYPSAEGLHIGGMRTFTGVDIYGRMKRMQGNDVFEPIGLDGFGIHSENYALKIGKHPVQHAKDSEKNFYRQLVAMGNGFAWNERLETYDPEYYKWTQWIFVQMFKRGLAYRKKAAVNWCSSCKTVLADEQVIAGKCERCSTDVIKKELEQWFFKITDYAERLLKNLDKIDWDERIKIAQRNWIGKSEGSEIKFNLAQAGVKRFVLLHGKGGSSDRNFLPWLKFELEKGGYEVEVPDLPNTLEPNDEEQTQWVLKKCHLDEKTVVVGHSFGGLVALRLLERGIKLKRVILVATPFTDKFLDGKERPMISAAVKKGFDFKAAKENCGDFSLLYDEKDDVVPIGDGESFSEKLATLLTKKVGGEPHFCAEVEADVLDICIPSIKVFTTRPDTLFGVTYMVLGPEHSLVENLKFKIENWGEINDYIKKAIAKTDEERIAEGKDPSTGSTNSPQVGSGRGKTGVELKGIKAINPANKEEIPVWVADYVLGNVGTGAIMAVPAHDQRDFEFAKKLNLPIKMVVCPHYPEKTCPVLDGAYEGEGHLVDSGEFNGMPSTEAKWEIAEFVKGKRRVNYRLRDWLISRQRYWGPPIPMIYCEKCALRHGSGQAWQPVPEKDLPVELPNIKNFRPTGTDKSPLAAVEKFYKVRCPKCRAWARRETDVSDSFLDSAWYYIGYLMKFGNWKLEIGNSALTELMRRWLPVHSYIGGAEHSVLHLLYSRFLAMAFHDWGMLDFEEPFTTFRAHGLITKDGAKMSKSKGNVVNPDEYIKVYGTDVMRMYLAFLAPLTQDGDFRDEGIRGITRFLKKVWTYFEDRSDALKKYDVSDFTTTLLVKKELNRTIKKVTEDIEGLQYNTAISALMIFSNILEKDDQSEYINSLGEISNEDARMFLKLLAPFAPHIAEELYSSFVIRNSSFRSIHLEPWPEYDPKLIQEDTFELIIQVNGKMRGRTILAVGTGEEEAKKAALAQDSVKKYILTEPRKAVFVPNKLINFVI